MKLEMTIATLTDLSKGHTRVVRGHVVTRWGDKYEVDTHGRKVDGDAETVARAIVEEA